MEAARNIGMVDKGDDVVVRTANEVAILKNSSGCAVLSRTIAYSFAQVNIEEGFVFDRRW